MAEQLALTAPGSGGKEMPVQARVLARRGDPETSKEAARKVALRFIGNEHWAMSWIRAFGPGTTHEMSAKGIMVDRGKIHHELARRLPELERKGLVRVQQDPSNPCRCKPNAKRCRCRDVVRDGSRVWEVA